MNAFVCPKCGNWNESRTSCAKCNVMDSKGIYCVISPSPDRAKGVQESITCTCATMMVGGCCPAHGFSLGPAIQEPIKRCRLTDNSSNYSLEDYAEALMVMSRFPEPDIGEDNDHQEKLIRILKVINSMELNGENLAKGVSVMASIQEIIKEM